MRANYSKRSRGSGGGILALLALGFSVIVSLALCVTTAAALPSTPPTMVTRDVTAVRCGDSADCPATGCCVSGVCQPEAACATLIAAADASSAGKRGAVCSESTYSQCTTGCCVNGFCSPHDVCWPPPQRSNLGSHCSASTLQQCDSGCCFQGRCAPVDVCFATGQGKRHGSACPTTPTERCASNCCVNGTCASAVECFGEKTTPLTPLLSVEVDSSNVTSCVRDHSGIASAGIACPCEHVFICGECIPSTSELRGAFAALNRNCSAAQSIIDSWRNAKTPRLALVCPQDTTWDPISYSCEPKIGRRRGRRSDDRDVAESSGHSILRRDPQGERQSCIQIGITGSVQILPCAAGLSCDPLLFVCVAKPTSLRRADLACPRGSNSDSAVERIDEQHPGADTYFDTQSLPVAIGTCQACYGNGQFLGNCPASTACDVGSGLCLPVVRNAYEANAIMRALDCTGSAPLGTKVSSPDQCSTCWADWRDMTCGPAPASFLVATKWIHGYYNPTYGDGTSQMKTYNYLSCLLTKGVTANIRGSAYNVESNFGLAVGPGGAVETSWKSALNSTFGKLCNCGSNSRARKLFDRSEHQQQHQQKRGTSCPSMDSACAEFVSDCAVGVPTDALAVLGQWPLECSVVCEVRQELDWLEDSRAWLMAEEKLLGTHFQNTKDAFKEAIDLVINSDGGGPITPEMDLELASSIYISARDSFGVVSYLVSAASSNVDVVTPPDLGAVKNEAFNGPLLALLTAANGLLPRIMQIAAIKGVDPLFYTVFQNYKGGGSDAVPSKISAGALMSNLDNFLSATRRALRELFLQDINTSHDRLHYMSRMTKAAQLSSSTLDYSSLPAFTAPLKTGMLQHYVRLLIPNRYMLCSVDQVEDWIGASGDSCELKAAGYSDCPSWCGSNPGSIYSYSGNPPFALQTKVTQGLSWPDFRYPNPRDDALFTEVDKTYYWMCDVWDASGGVSQNTMQAAGCRSQARPRIDGTDEIRWLCGQEGFDLADLQFALGYWASPYFDVQWSRGQNLKGHDYSTPRLYPRWKALKNNRMNTCVDHL